MDFNCLFKRGKKYLCLILSPIVNNFPLFITTFLLWSVETLRNLHGRMVTYDPTVSFYDLFSRLSIIILFAYLFAVLSSITGRKWIKSIIYLFVVTIFTLYLFLQKVFGLSISPNIVMLLAETNPDESNEFVNTFVLSPTGISSFFIVTIVIVLILLEEFFYSKKILIQVKRKIESNCFFLILSFVLILFGIFSSKIYLGLFSCKSTDEVGEWNGDNRTPKDPLSLVVFSIHGVRIVGEEQKMFEEMMTKVDKNISCNINDSLNLVIVIGESYIKYHSYLYGYPLNTTPNLIQEKDKNLFVFKDVVSPFATTSATIKNVLCLNSISDNEYWNSCYFFPTIFRMAGYDVFFWDNQKDFGTSSILSFTLNSFLYNKVIVESYTAYNDKSYRYDDSIVSSFDSICLTNKHNLILFHLMGQHVDQAERFPHTKEFLHFTIDSINRHERYMTDEKRHLIADYDNATYYNDYVISKIINRFRNSNTVLVYFSDHGEEIYDYRDSMGRVNENMNKNLVKYQFEIPFMIWCSDTFKKKNPEKIEMIRKSLNRPFMIDNLGQMMFNLGGIKSRYYRKERDLISPNFKPRKRLINGNVDYDQIMHTK